jgi:hypothetical protein
VCECPEVQGKWEQLDEKICDYIKKHSSLPFSIPSWVQPGTILTNNVPVKIEMSTERHIRLADDERLERLQNLLGGFPKQTHRALIKVFIRQCPSQEETEQEIREEYLERDQD